MGAKLIVLGNEFEKNLLQNVYLNNTYKTSLSAQHLTAVLLQKFLHVSIEENPFEKGFFLKLLS